MIRRALWLLLGAALGIAGYRRAGRLARAMLPAGRPGRRLALGGRPEGGRTTAFLLDVKEGMDEYLGRHHRGLAGPTLEGQQVRRRLGSGASEPRCYPGIDYVKDGR